LGKKQQAVKRVILDTNVLISALLFKGKLSNMRELWRTGKIVPLISRETFDELRRVLAYPKFFLTRAEIRSILEGEILPFFEVVDVSRRVKGVCRDSADDKFISCAISGRADYIVTGDRDLSSLKRYQSIRIIHSSDFLRMFE
jgi:putative PIN family toxin of toxin-antitoxin system